MTTDSNPQKTACYARASRYEAVAREATYHWSVIISRASFLPSDSARSRALGHRLADLNDLIRGCYVAAEQARVQARAVPFFEESALERARVEQIVRDDIHAEERRCE